MRQYIRNYDGACSRAIELARAYPGQTFWVSGIGLKPGQSLMAEEYANLGYMVSTAHTLSATSVVTDGYEVRPRAQTAI